MISRKRSAVCKGNYAATVMKNTPACDLLHKRCALQILNISQVIQRQVRNKSLDISKYEALLYLHTDCLLNQRRCLMAKHSDPKADALRNQGTLNPHPEQVRDGFFLENDFFDARDLLQVKYEMLRKTQVEGECVTRAAAAFGFSRPAFYQARQAFEEKGLPGLIPERRGPKHGHKLTEAIMGFIQEALEGDESLRTTDLVRMIEEQWRIRVHRRSVERALVRRQKKGR